MVTRYTEEVLLHLRLSPLCIRPNNLPPAEDWMGPAVEAVRTPKSATDRSKPQDGPLADHTNRRPDANRHTSRSNANPDDIILGPPRTNFSSAFGGSATSRNSFKSGENEKGSRDQVGFNFRTRNGEGDGFNDRSSDRLRDGRSSLRPREDRDQDSDGWSTVKPRKSFGHEGAERFQGRGALRGDSFREDRRSRDKDDLLDSNKDRQRRPFDNHGRKDGEESDQRWNNLQRGRSEPWFRDNNHEERERGERVDRGDRTNQERNAQRERIDRAKSWRDRDPEDHGRDRNDRHNDRRFDHRDRAERDPEWLDEPAGEKAGGHTEEDFKKFMESMKAGKGKKPEASQPEPTAATSVAPKVESPPVSNDEPDKFFMNFASNTGPAAAQPEIEAKRDSTQAKGAKSSRFTSFFSAPQAPADVPAPPSAAAGPPPAAAGGIPFGGANGGGLAALFGGHDPALGSSSSQPDVSEKQAFAALLQKLQRQTLTPGASSPPPYAPPPDNGSVQQQPSQKPQQPQQHNQPRAQPPFVQQQPLPQQGPSQPPLPPQQKQQGPLYQQQQQHHHQIQLQNVLQDARQKQVGISPELFQQYGGDRRGPQPPHMIPMPATLPPTTRPEQMLQDLLEQRHQAPSQGSGRGEMPQSNKQVEFLMKLMQQQPEPRRTEEVLMRMPQPQKQPVNLPMMTERELEFPRERQGSGTQRPMRPQGPPGLFEDQFHRLDGEGRPPQPQGQPRPQPQGQPQPTQILQRPPPGLDHQLHPPFIPSGGQGPPLGQQRGPMIPPPGLQGLIPGPGGPMGPASPSRHMGPGMFHPNFPPHGAFPPDGMVGPPRMQPPPGFFGGPPPPPGHPGFMPPPGPPGIPGFQGGPEGMPFGFDGRGMPPPGVGGHFRRA